jgi:hypothetical protein
MRTTITAVGQNAVLNTERANSAFVHVKGGTVNATGANLAFEASIDSTDGTNGTWFSVQAARTNSNTAESSTGALALNVGVGNTYAHRFNVSAYRYLRLRATALTAGNVVVTLNGSAAELEPTPVTPTHAVTQSGTWSVTGATPAGTTFNVVSAASTNLSNQVAAAANLFEVSVSNPTATAAFVKFYNKATAPTLASDVPVLTLSVPAGSTQTVSFGQIGKRFASGISLAITGAAAATDATAAVAGVVVNGTRI